MQQQNLNYEDNPVPQQDLFLQTVADQMAAGNDVEYISVTLGFNELAALASEPDPLGTGRAPRSPSTATTTVRFSRP